MFLFKKAETFCLWMFLLREKSNLRKLEVLLMEIPWLLMEIPWMLEIPT